MVGVHGVLSWSCFEIPLSCTEQWFCQGRAGCKDRPAALLPEGTDLSGSKIWKNPCLGHCQNNSNLGGNKSGKADIMASLIVVLSGASNRQASQKFQENLGNMTAIISFDKLPHILGDMGAAQT